MTFKVPPPEMFDNYETGQYIPPPQAKEINERGNFKPIVYQATAPTADKFSFRADRNGFLMVVIDGLTLEGGYEMRKDYASSAPFPKKDRAGNVTGTRNASSFGNYLRAFGLAVRPSSPEEYEALALSTAGQSCSVTIDWEAYDNDTKTTVASTWEQFPEDPEKLGTRLPYIELNGKRFWARAGVKRYVDQVG
jgi:hypothetical protein